MDSCKNNDALDVEFGFGVTENPQFAVRYTSEAQLDYEYEFRIEGLPVVDRATFEQTQYGYIVDSGIHYYFSVFSLQEELVLDGD